MKRVVIVVTTIALIAAMVSCADGESYALAISSTAGGWVTIPGEGMFTYDEGTVVNLTAEAEEGYRFVNWTGDVDTVADSEAAATTITMSDSYFVTASFIAVYDLTISSNAGGNVTVPGEGMFAYDEGTVVDFVAETEEGYSFIEWTGDVITIADVNAPTTSITVDDDYSITGNFGYFGYPPMVAAGGAHTVGVKSDGAVVAVGDNSHGQLNVGGWMDMAQVAAGERHTVGLKSDGTVVAVGHNSDGQLNVGGWMGVVQVAAGNEHTVGPKFDGSVVAVGLNDHGQCDVGNWTNIVQVAAASRHTVGLKSDGTVVAVGWNNDGQCDVGDWTDIIQVAVGNYHTVGLKSDGTVIAVGLNTYLQCDVGGWDLN